jgi:hypothetical protein
MFYTEDPVKDFQKSRPPVLNSCCRASCRIHAVGHRRDADAEKNIREGLPLVPLRLVDGCDPVKSRAAGGGSRPLPRAAHR